MKIKHRSWLKQAGIFKVADIYESLQYYADLNKNLRSGGFKYNLSVFGWGDCGDALLNDILVISKSENSTNIFISFCFYLYYILLLMFR